MSILDKFLHSKSKKINSENPALYMQCLDLIRDRPGILNTEIPLHLLNYLIIEDFDLMYAQEDPDVINLFFIAIELNDRYFFPDKIRPISDIRLYGYFIQFQIFLKMAYLKYHFPLYEMVPVQIFNFMKYRNYGLRDEERIIKYYKELTEHK